MSLLGRARRAWWGTRGRGERVGDRGGRGELGGTQRDLDLVGSPFEVALPATAFQRGPDLTEGQPDAGRWCRRLDQYPQRVAVGQVRECFQRCRVVLAQAAAQRVRCRLRVQIRF